MAASDWQMASAPPANLVFSFSSVAITTSWTVLASYVILRVISVVIGFLLTSKMKSKGFLSQHGERGYHSIKPISSDENGICSVVL